MNDYEFSGSITSNVLINSQDVGNQYDMVAAFIGGELRGVTQAIYNDILDNERRNGFMYKDTYHQLSAKDYCEDHENAYSEHKCKPNWCGDCGYLSKYDITVDWDKKEKKW